MLTKKKIYLLLGILLVLILPFGSASIAKASLPGGSSPSDSWAVDLGDLDGDGDLDAFVGNQDSVNGTGPEGFNEVWFNNGDATFTYSSQQLGQEDTEAVKLADLDNDLDLDAFTANTTGPIIWINDGAGSFTEGPTLGSAYANAVDVGDLDNDGDLDAFVGVFGSPDQVWINQGEMTFTLEQEVGANEPARHVALGYLDDDSYLDVFVVNHFNQTNIVYLNDGTGHFTLGQTISNHDAVDLSLGDIDNDGDIDAFVGNSSGEADDLYVNDGAGKFSPASQIGDYNTEATALGDLNGDGYLDIYMGDGFGGDNRIWLNNGDGTFVDSNQSLGYFNTFGTALGDLDGDGDLDIFDANWMAETVWLNDGAGTFSFGQFLGVPAPLPNLAVDYAMDWVITENWPVGTELTLSIDDQDPDTENYTATKPFIPEAPFPHMTFKFRGEYFVKKGDIVTIDGGGVQIEYVVEYISVDEVNPDTNTIRGIAEPGANLIVKVSTPKFIKKPITANEITGEWEIILPGGDDDYLTPDSWGQVFMNGSPGGPENFTAYTWYAPIPTTHEIEFWWDTPVVNKYDEIVLGADWQACTPSLVKVFQKAAHIGITINGQPFYPDGDEALFWSPIEPMELDGCTVVPTGDKASMSSWQYTLNPLEPGIYEVYVWLDHPVINGVDEDGDGRMDLYEGTLVENTISIVVK